MITEAGRGNQTHPGAMIVAATALMSIGLVMVTSATASLDRSYFGVPFWRTTYGRQAVFVVVGLVAMIITWRAGVPLLARPAARRWIPWALFGAALVSLVAAFIPGWADARHGSHRWLQLTSAWSGIGFQPSELAKLALVVFLAMWFSEGTRDAHSFRRGFVPAAAAIGICVALIGTEDFSTAALVGGVGLLVLLVAGCRLRHLLLLGTLGGCGLGVLLITAPYRIARLTAYQSFWDDPRGAGYQPLQSLTTIASGGWLGTGLGAGVQKYGYLPESHSDFIFAVICEEAGILGGGLVIALFGALVWLGLQTMRHARTRFERLVAFGLTACLGLQAAMNIAVVTVAAPTTGIPLPFISAGGSGLLVYSLAIGSLAAVAARTTEITTLAEHTAEGDDAAYVRLKGQEGLTW